jgi:hypothetical protein
LRLTEREVTVLLADFATVWKELFPAEQARIVELLVERVDVRRTRPRCVSGRGTDELGRGVPPARREEGGRRVSAETTFDGKKLAVRIPVRFQQRSGRKRIVAPDGSAPNSKPRPDSTLIKALARAWLWQKLLDDGVYASVTEISEAEGIN